MKERDHRDYLHDILHYMSAVEKFTAGMSFDEFAEDEKTIYAVVRGIEVVGEATKHIPNSIRSKYPMIPWKDMAGIRDRVIHGYFVVDLEIIWKTATEEFPELKPEIKRIVSHLPSKDLK
jgi:uncharacterized protein with HEPN domain